MTAGGGFEGVNGPHGWKKSGDGELTTLLEAVHSPFLLQMGTLSLDVVYPGTGDRGQGGAVSASAIGHHTRSCYETSCRLGGLLVPSALPGMPSQSFTPL